MGQKVISKWGSFDNFLIQIGENFISKWGQRQLFQSGAANLKWGKMLFQSGTVFSKWGITLSSIRDINICK